jgi:hypothetical protein
MSIDSIKDHVTELEHWFIHIFEPRPIDDPEETSDWLARRKCIRTHGYTSRSDHKLRQYISPMKISRHFFRKGKRFNVENSLINNYVNSITLATEVHQTASITSIVEMHRNTSITSIVEMPRNASITSIVEMPRDILTPIKQSRDLSNEHQSNQLSLELIDRIRPSEEHGVQHNQISGIYVSKTTQRPLINLETRYSMDFGPKLPKLALRSKNSLIGRSSRTLPNQTQIALRSIPKSNLVVPRKSKIRGPMRPLLASRCKDDRLCIIPKCARVIRQNVSTELILRVPDNYMSQNSIDVISQLPNIPTLQISSNPAPQRYIEISPRISSNPAPQNYIEINPGPRSNPIPQNQVDLVSSEKIDSNRSCQPTDNKFRPVSGK